MLTNKYFYTSKILNTLPQTITAHNYLSTHQVRLR
uniref:Uncharacterized protein n=1 Tax=Rhizophora mucronata TaxID=61149 RepID=A0A2P2QBI6_RHIMU